MATVNSSAIYGLFQAGKADFAEITESDITISAVECREPLFLILDLSSASADAVLSVFDDEGKVAKEILLAKGELNVVPMTTNGIEDSEGNIKLQIDTYEGIKATVIGYTSVVNH